MTLPLQVVDAFTAEVFRGNPAAVVRLDAVVDPERDDTWMQAVAAEMKHSETAFVAPRPDGDFDLRWFTPATEVDLCGHATLAGAHALWDWGVLNGSEPARFHTRSGLLTATRRGDMIEMDFPATPAVAADAPPGLFDALGVNAADALDVRRSDFYVLVEVADGRTVRTLSPDFVKLEAVDTRAVIVTARDDDFDIVSRTFGPRVGIDEDPVTGSAHCVLATHWADRLGPELRAYQASARGGVVHTRLEGDRVVLGGAAVTVIRGALA
ncbi:MAG: oxidoreductase [Actinomycetia bacterium]|nr:oxidoreductase [Actinomycetes bacterium]